MGVFFLFLYWNDISVSRWSQRAIKADTFFLREFDRTSADSEESVIGAAFYIFSRMDFSTTLADNDAAGFDWLTVGDFGAEVLRLRVSAKPSRATRLFMSHTLQYCFKAVRSCLLARPVANHFL